MKKLLFGIIAILAATAFLSCSKNESKAQESQASSDDTVVTSENIAGTSDNTDAQIIIESEENVPEALDIIEEPSVQEEQNASENEAYSHAYRILKEYIEEKGEEDEDGKVVTYFADEVTCIFFELDNDGQMKWSAYFPDEDATSVLTVYVDDRPQTEHEVEMIMQKTESEEVYIWEGVLDTASLNYSDFNTVNLEITAASSDEFTTEQVLPTMTINTQIAVLCAEIAMDGLELDISVEDFGFPKTV